MNANLIIRIISFLYFNSPIIMSVIFILMGVISFFREYDFHRKFIAGVVGIISIAITSIFLSFLPQTSWSDRITFWIFKILFPLLILFAIADTSEGKFTGITALYGFLLLGIAGTFFLN